MCFCLSCLCAKRKCNGIVRRPKPQWLNKIITATFFFFCTYQLSTSVTREVLFIVVLQRSSPHSSSGRSLWLLAHRRGIFLAEVMLWKLSLNWLKHIRGFRGTRELHADHNPVRQKYFINSSICPRTRDGLQGVKVGELASSPHR